MLFYYIHERLAIDDKERVPLVVISMNVIINRKVNITWVDGGQKKELGEFYHRLFDALC